MTEHEGGGGAIRELLAVFGFGVDTEELKKGEAGLEHFAERVKRLAGAVAAAFVIHEANEWAEANVKAMSEIEHAAARLGISAEEVQSYQYAARAVGLESESLIDMMGRLQVTQEMAAQGSKQAAQAFTMLGVSTKDAAGKSKDADQLFTDVAEGIAKQTDASKQAAIATALFGRQGRALLPILKDGKAGLEELKEEFRALGGGYSEDAIEAAKQYERQSAKLNLVLTVLKSKTLTQLLPILTKIAKGTMAIVQSLTELIKQSNIVEAALIVLGSAGAAFAIQMAIANAPLLLLTAALAGLILIVDDFITMMEGGQSAIGDLIDKVYGKDAHVDTVRDIRDAWRGVKDALSGLRDVIGPIWGFFKWVTENAGALGDAMARLDMRIGEQTGKYPHLQQGPRTGGGLTFEQGAAAREAQRLLEARTTGETFHLQNVPASFKGHENEFMADVMQWADAIKGGGYPQFAPRTFGPEAQPPIIVQQTINAAPGMDEKQLGEHAAKRVGEVLKQERRAAAATFQRKAAQ